MLTPQRLQGLVHPVRMRILHLLRDEGPATSTLLAARTGQSTGVTSYHLRVLARHGYVVEDEGRGNRRDRWWRAAHRFTIFTFRDPDEPGTPDDIEAAAQYLRLAVAGKYERMLAYIDTLDVRRDELAELPYTFADFPLSLTREEAFALRRDIEALVAPYRQDRGHGEAATGARAGAEDVVLQMQLLPREPAGAESREVPSGP